MKPTPRLAKHSTSGVGSSENSPKKSYKDQPRARSRGWRQRFADAWCHISSAQRSAGRAVEKAAWSDPFDRNQAAGLRPPTVEDFGAVFFSRRRFTGTFVKKRFHIAEKGASKNRSEGLQAYLCCRGAISLHRLKTQLKPVDDRAMASPIFRLPPFCGLGSEAVDLLFAKRYVNEQHKTRVSFFHSRVFDSIRNGDSTKQGGSRNQHGFY